MERSAFKLLTWSRAMEYVQVFVFCFLFAKGVHESKDKSYTSDRVECDNGVAYETGTPWIVEGEWSHNSYLLGSTLHALCRATLGKEVNLTFIILDGNHSILEQYDWIRTPEQVQYKQHNISNGKRCELEGTIKLSLKVALRHQKTVLACISQAQSNLTRRCMSADTFCAVVGGINIRHGPDKLGLYGTSAKSVGIIVLCTIIIFGLIGFLLTGVISQRRRTTTQQGEDKDDDDDASMYGTSVDPKNFDGKSSGGSSSSDSDDSDSDDDDDDDDDEEEEE